MPSTLLHARAEKIRVVASFSRALSPKRIQIVIIPERKKLSLHRAYTPFTCPQLP